MPRMVDKLTEEKNRTRTKFTEEQMCVYLLTKTIRCQYRFDDEFISNWYEEIFNNKPEHIDSARRELIQAYTNSTWITG